MTGERRGQSERGGGGARANRSAAWGAEPRPSRPGGRHGRGRMEQLHLPGTAPGGGAYEGGGACGRGGAWPRGRGLTDGTNGGVVQSEGLKRDVIGWANPGAV